MLFPVRKRKLRFPWKDQRKGTSFSGLAFYLYITAEQVSKPFCNREAQPEPASLPGQLSSVTNKKRLEQGVFDIGRHSVTIVFYRKTGL